MDEQITPLAKKLAEENSIDWRFIRGTGPTGKVIERDILSYLARIMSGELDLPTLPDASEPAGPGAGAAGMPDLGQVANFEAVSANMAKEGVDLNSMLGDFGSATQTNTAMPPIPELDFSMPPTEITTSSVSNLDADYAVFEFEMDDIDDVAPVSAVPVAAVPGLDNPDLFPTEITPPLTAVSSFDEDQIMTVSDDHDDALVPLDHVTLSPSHDEISVNISGEFERIPDPLENLPFELDSQSSREPAHTLIVDDATFPIETDLVVDIDDTEVVQVPPVVHHEPEGLSLEGLAAVGVGALGVNAALGQIDHPPVVSPDLNFELETPVVPEPVIAVPVVHVQAEPVVVVSNPEPMIVHFDPEPEPVVAHIEPEPVIHVEPEPVVHVEPEPVAASPEPEPVPYQAPSPAVIPVVAPVAQVTPSSHSALGATTTAGIHKDFFNTNILRRQFNANALNDIRAQISKALNGREVQLGVFVGRAAQRGLYLLGNTEQVTLHKLESGLVPLSTAGLHHSFIEAVQSLNHAETGEARGLAVLDASHLGVDDLVLPVNGALLALGRISNDIGTLTLSGDFSAKEGAEFLAHVAQALEAPVGLVL